MTALRVAPYRCGVCGRPFEDHQTRQIGGLGETSRWIGISVVSGILVWAVTKWLEGRR